MYRRVRGLEIILEKRRDVRHKLIFSWIVPSSTRSALTPERSDTTVYSITAPNVTRRHSKCRTCFGLLSFPFNRRKGTRRGCTGTVLAEALAFAIDCNIVYSAPRQ